MKIEAGRRIVFALAGFAALGLATWTGIHWKDGTLKDSIQNPRHIRPALEGWGRDNPVALAILSVLAGASLMPVITYFAGKLAPSTMLDMLFRDSTKVRLAMSKMAIHQFQTSRVSQPINLPSNTPLMPMGDALGLALLSETAKAAYGDSKSIDIRDEIWPGESFIAVGGAFVNDDAAEIQDQIPDYEYDPDAETLTFKGYKYHAIRKAATDPNSKLLRDYGFIVFVQGAEPTEKTINVWGIWPPGTHAAAATFLTENRMSLLSRYIRAAKYCLGLSPNDHLYRFRSAIQEGSDAVLVIEVDRIKLAAHSCKVVRMESITTGAPNSSPTPYIGTTGTAP
jgi:hypothetical protein